MLFKFPPEKESDVSLSPNTLGSVVAGVPLVSVPPLIVKEEPEPFPKKLAPGPGFALLNVPVLIKEAVWKMPVLETDPPLVKLTALFVSSKFNTPLPSIVTLVAEGRAPDAKIFNVPFSTLVAPQYEFDPFVRVRSVPPAIVRPPQGAPNVKASPAASWIEPANEVVAPPLRVRTPPPNTTWEED